MRSQRRLVSPLSDVNLSPNTFIGGVATSVPDKSTLALRLNISESNISYFAIVGNNIEASVNVNYVLSSFSEFSGIRSYIDKGKCTALGIPPSGYFGVLDSVEVMEFPVATYHGGRISNGVYTINSKLKTLYIPNVVNYGQDRNNNNLFWDGNYSEVTVYAHASMETINGGAEEGDLVYAKTRQVTVIYIQDFTAPNAINNLSIGTKYATALQLNFIPPSSVNGIYFYEVYVNGVYKDSILGSGGYITGLTPGNTYIIKIKAIDIYYNKSQFSNSVSETTNTTEPYTVGNIISYYKFNDSLVDAMSGHNGVGTAITYAAGKSGNAASFNGSTSIVKIQNDAFGIFGTTNFSMSCFVKLNSMPSSLFNTIMAIQKSTSAGTVDKSIKISPDGSVSFYAYSGSPKNATSAIGKVTINTWVHLCGTYDGVTLRLYINGVLEASIACSSTYNEVTPTLVFSQRGGAVAVNGLIDGASIWNKALSQNEITEVYNKQNSGFEII